MCQDIRFHDHSIHLQILTGEGLFGQLSSLTGAPKPVVILFLLGTVANNAIAALHPQSPTFSQENQQDVAKRNKASPQYILLHCTPQGCLRYRLQRSL